MLRGNYFNILVNDGAVDLHELTLLVERTHGMLSKQQLAKVTER